MIIFAAYTFTLLAAVVAVFQLALVAGAPWGRLTQGGRHDGTLPPGPRAAAAASAVVTTGLALLLLGRSGALGPAAVVTVGPWAWVVVAVSVMTTVANAITPSAVERRTWLPVAVVMVISSLIVVLGGP